MHLLTPAPALAPWVERIWCADDRGVGGTAPRERVLPTGRASLVVRLSSEPVRVFADERDARGATFGHAVIGGARARAHERDTARPSVSVGVQFRPGGAAAFLGVPASELAERHTALVDLWGRAADELRERLLAARSPRARLALFEAELVARLRTARPVHPDIAAALLELRDCRGPARVDAAWHASGFSRRHFAALFRREVGLPPKVFARVERLQAVVQRAARAARPSWTELAAAAGYADQSHLVREFHALAGFAPGAYRPLPGRASHVPLPVGAVRSRTSKSAAPRAR